MAQVAGVRQVANFPTWYMACWCSSEIESATLGSYRKMSSFMTIQEGELAVMTILEFCSGRNVNELLCIGICLSTDCYFGKL
jgi:hypothetical protein